MYWFYAIANGVSSKGELACISFIGISPVYEVFSNVWVFEFFLDPENSDNRDSFNWTILRQSLEGRR